MFIRQSIVFENKLSTPAEESRNVILLSSTPQTRTKAFVLSYDLQSALLCELESRNSSLIYTLAMIWTTANTIITGLIVRTAVEADTAEDHEVAPADPVKGMEDIEIDQCHDRCRAKRSATSVRNLAVGQLDIPTMNGVRHLTNFANTARECLIDNGQQ